MAQSQSNRASPVALGMRIARIAANLTVGELARRAAIDRSTVTRVEAGRFIPQARTMRKLLRVLGATSGRKGRQRHDG